MGEIDRPKNTSGPEVVSMYDLPEPVEVRVVDDWTPVPRARAVFDGWMMVILLIAGIMAHFGVV